MQIADGIMGPSQGVLRGCGRQLQLMFSNGGLHSRQTGVWLRRCRGQGCVCPCSPDQQTLSKDHAYAWAHSAPATCPTPLCPHIPASQPFLTPAAHPASHHAPAPSSTAVTVLAFWLMGVFLGYMLTFRAGLGVRGLWIGIMSGDFTAGADLTKPFASQCRLSQCHSHTASHKEACQYDDSF